ncbi:MAG: hypothetical protein K6253_03170 [Candidatus Liberibacter asiaticus]|nr:hypothetical protein [Candidatus Liberibacter asiaticus]
MLDPHNICVRSPLLIYIYIYIYINYIYIRVLFLILRSNPYFFQKFHIFIHKVIHYFHDK